MNPDQTLDVSGLSCPLPMLRALGAWIGRVLFVLAAPRRRVALRNLELCFPEVPEAQRRAWARESFEVFCQTFLDRGWLWSGSEALVRSRVKWSKSKTRMASWCGRKKPLITQRASAASNPT